MKCNLGDIDGSYRSFILYSDQVVTQAIQGTGSLMLIIKIIAIQFHIVLVVVKEELVKGLLALSSK